MPICNTGNYIKTPKISLGGPRKGIQVHHGVPSVTSNIDTVGTSDMAKAVGRVFSYFQKIKKINQ